MSNSKKGGEVTPKLLAAVAAVLASAEKHTYSVSKVYAAYNEATGKNETPQTCPSCLTSRVAVLKKWYKENGGKEEKPVSLTEMLKAAGVDTEDPAKEYEALDKTLNGKVKFNKEEIKLITDRSAELLEGLKQYNDPSAPHFQAPAKGVTRYPVAEGLPFDFTPGKEDANKGTIALADGAKVKAGTHTTADGTTLVVQANGQARIEAAEDLT